MLCTFHQVYGALEHVSDEGDDVEARECCCVALVILDQPATACGPGEGSFDDPASGQQNKPALCLWQFDDVQSDALSRGGRGGGIASVALIDIGEADAVAGCILDISSETADRSTIATSASVTCRASRWPSVSTAICTLDPRFRLAPS